MISEKFCGEQLSRLAHLQYFPKARTGVSDLICALQAAETEAIACDVVDSWISALTAGQPVAPLPADLRAMAYAANEREAIKRAEAAPPKPTRAHCAECADYGVVEGIHDGKENLDSVARWCECEAGKRFRQITPGWVDSVNNARASLRAKFPNWAKENPLRAIAAKKPSHVDWARF